MLDLFGYFTTAVTVLTALVNIITQVIKGVTYDKIPTRAAAFIISMALSVAATLAWCSAKGIDIMWQHAAGGVGLGFITAYAAMYGYDNLYGELFSAIKKLFGGEKKDEN